MKKILITFCLAAFSLHDIFAFCGFYVAKADASLFNKTSQVIIARDGNRSVITMSSDFGGDVKDFAMVVPVPEVLSRDQIKVVERVIFDKLDAYSAPRLVEYYDSHPCYDYMLCESKWENASTVKRKTIQRTPDKATGVTIEATYNVGEYNILILSAEQSSGLEIWLTENGYKIPSGAREVLEPYIKSKLKFFVVKVNLDKHEKDGSVPLRPIQISFNSPKFMLPIRLGMANAETSQDMIVYAFSRKGRIETTNYRTVKIPTDKNVPEFTKDRFGEFYKDMYTTAWKREGKNIVFLEYSWNLSSSNFVKCDPCPVQPPLASDLSQAGVFWIHNQQYNNYEGDVYMTRLHLTYDRKGFPQDLVFQETPARENFQGRYIITHPAQGPFDCQEADDYLLGLQKRRYEELTTLASLTGWDISQYPDYAGKYSKHIKNKKDVKKNLLLPLLPPMPPDPMQKLPLILVFTSSLALLLILLAMRNRLNWQK